MRADKWDLTLIRLPFIGYLTSLEKSESIAGSTSRTAFTLCHLEFIHLKGSKGISCVRMGNSIKDKKTYERSVGGWVDRWIGGWKGRWVDDESLDR